jgi:hypothetical protein
MNVIKFRPNCLSLNLDGTSKTKLQRFTWLRSIYRPPTPEKKNRAVDDVLLAKCRVRSEGPDIGPNV